MGWGSPPGQVGSPRLAPPAAPAHHCNPYRPEAHFSLKVAKRPGLPGCQAFTKNTPQTHFRPGSLEKRKSERVLVGMEMTWNEAGEERKGRGGRREKEVAQRLERCPRQVKARLSLKDELVVPGGAE